MGAERELYPTLVTVVVPRHGLRDFWALQAFFLRPAGFRPASSTVTGCADVHTDLRRLRNASGHEEATDETETGANPPVIGPPV